MTFFAALIQMPRPLQDQLMGLEQDYCSPISSLVLAGNPTYWPAVSLNRAPALATLWHHWVALDFVSSINQQVQFKNMY